MFRRVMQPQPQGNVSKLIPLSEQMGYSIRYDPPVIAAPGITNHGNIIKCPYGQPGDRLWVRETFRLQNFSCDYGHWSADICYRVDESISEHRALFVSENERIGWRPSIHMPRWASRITLEVTGVRVERVNDISLADVLKEGIGLIKDEYGFADTRATLDSFQTLWDKINAKRGYSWDSNPWVWVGEFKQVAAAKEGER